MPDSDSPTVSGLPADRLMAAALSSTPVSSPAFAWVPPPPEEVAAWFPEYEVEALAGRGAMGAVYRAVQRKLSRPVAIKLLPAELAARDGVEARFEREARALALLNHPGIVALHDFGRTAGGHLFIVMEYVDGTDLSRLIHAEGGGLGVEHALEIVGQVCDALQYAHSRGFVHRDIKPGNVLVDKDGRVKIVDFGLAKLGAPPPGGNVAPAQLTHTGQALGTPDYTAPEQLKGGPVDHRADIYSLGVMFYEMLTGDLPRGAWPPPSQCTAAPARLDEVVTRAMQSEPANRYQQASEVKAAATAIESPAVRPAATYSSVNRVMVWLMFAFIVASAFLTPTGDMLTMLFLAAPFLALAVYFKMKRRPAGLVSLLLAGIAMGAAITVGIIQFDAAERSRRSGAAAQAGEQPPGRIDPQIFDAEVEIRMLEAGGFGNKHPKRQAAQARLDALRLRSEIEQSIRRGASETRPVANISPLLDGRLEKLVVSAGQQVGPGELLAVMDATAIKMELTALKRSIEERLAKETSDGDLEILKLESELGALQVSQSEDSAVVKGATRQVEAAKAISSKLGALVMSEATQKAELELEKANARLSGMNEQHSKILESINAIRKARQDSAKTLEALKPVELTDLNIVPLLPLAADEHNRRDELLAKLAGCDLKSPFAGKVESIGKQPGEFVKAGEAILKLTPATE